MESSAELCFSLHLPSLLLQYLLFPPAHSSQAHSQHLADGHQVTSAGRFLLLLLAFPTSLAAQLSSQCCPSSSEKPSTASWSLILVYFCTPGPPPLSDSLSPEGTPPRLTALRTIHMPMTPKWTSLPDWIHSSRLVFPEWTLSGHLKESS